jgi:hypothetical protein
MAVNAVVAGVALAVGGVATAGAAKLLTGKDIKNGSIEPVDLSAKAKASLAAKPGRAGVAGPVGAAGPDGAAGAAGQSGANGLNGAGATMPTMAANDKGTLYTSLMGSVSVNLNHPYGITSDRTLTISEMAVSATGLLATNVPRPSR